MRSRHVLINAMALSETGGGRSYLLNILRELNEDDRGFEFTVLAIEGKLDDRAVGRFRLREVALPGRLRTPARVGYEQTVLPLVARRYGLVYCPADLLPVRCSAPVVVALRNLNIYDRRFYDTPRTRFLFQIARWGVPNARRIVFPSRAAADEIAGRVGAPRDRLRVVHHGISPASFAGAAEPDTGGARYLFLAANLERHKNFETLFEGLRLVADRSLEFWVAGGEQLDPDWAAHLRRTVAELGLTERVRFLGPVPYAEVLGYYRRATALVFPSLLETFGHPLLEAMLAEIPIIASDLPAFREVAGDVAVYFPARDATALAKAVDTVLAEPAAAAQRVAAGRERVQGFTWKRSVDSLCRVFEEALSDR